jgi:hypothetical protein
VIERATEIRSERERWRCDWAERWHAMAVGQAHRSSPPGTPGLGGLGFLVQNGAEGKGVLTEGLWWRVGFLDGSRR